MNDAIRQCIAYGWGTTDLNRFPGPQPISIERRHFPLLKSQQYLVCEKSDGVRNMLVCFHFEGKKYCLLVDRMFNYTFTTLSVPIGTILDGELIDGVFMVFDAIMIKGQDVKQKPLTERLFLAKKLCSVILPTKGNVRLKVKQMLPLEKADEIEVIEGLIFTPVNEPVRTGTHETCFKWKPKHLNTIDFAVRPDGTITCLWIQNESIMPLTRVNAQGKDPKEYEGKIVECEYGKNGWSVMKIRTDKDHPNNKRTYDRTLVNIRENIQLEELFVYIAK